MKARKKEWNLRKKGSLSSVQWISAVNTRITKKIEE